MVDYLTPSKNIVKIIKAIDYLNNVSENYENKIIFPDNFEKINKNSISIPTIYNYINLTKYNYTIQELKKFAKHYKLKICGTKKELIKRIFVFLQLSYYVIKIQKNFRGSLQRKFDKLHGPAFKNRKLCTNDTDFITMENLNELDFKEMCIHNDKIDEKHIHYWYREGNYWELQYKKRLLTMDIIPNNKQEVIIKDISLYYEDFHQGVFFIYGEPGKGKSTLLRFLGHYYKCHICKTFQITDPNDSIEYLYRQVEPTKDKPLIILFDEIDTLIYSIHHNQIQKHKHFPIEVYNKTTYNTFLDNINDCLYPYVMLLLTSNKTKEEIDNETHSCYLRKGRVNKYFYL
jgi:hypothetical protein